MDQNGSLTVDFASYLSDPDGDIPVLSYSGNSTHDVSIDGYSVTFTPLSDWFGSELITFMLSDGLLEVNSAVQLTVNQVISHLGTHRNCILLAIQTGLSSLATHRKRHRILDLPSQRTGWQLQA
jgi:hypothetical protein